MNNKIVKRFAAVVLGVAVLSTCAFASEITSSSFSKGEETSTLTYNITSTANKISYIAYAARKTDATTATEIDGAYYNVSDVIVAVNQIDDNTSGSNGTVSIDSAKLSGYTHIVLMSGDSDGAGVAKVAMAIDDFTIASAIQNVGTLEVTINEVTYTNCPNFNVEVTINKAGKYKVAGFTREYQGVKENLTVVGGTLPTIDGTGVMTMNNVYVVDMPANIVAAQLKIEPVVELVE